MILNFDRAGILSDSDEFEFPLGIASPIQITSWTPGVQTAPSSEATIVIQDVTGGSPTNSISSTIASGQTIGVRATGSVPIAALGSVFVRVTTAASSQWLAGVAEYSGGAASGATLASLATLKAFLGITGSGEDTGLTASLEGASKMIVNRVRRKLLSTTITDEVHYGDGGSVLVLKDSPVQSISAITTGTTTIDSDTYEVDLDSGVVLRPSGVWTKGIKYEVDYTSGWATTPDDLREACILQAGYLYQRSKDGGGRLGNEGPANEEAGTPGFLTGAWEPSALEMVRAYRALNA